jgi:phenylpropionate dioxygenase-like ring-hydroxylating dioxygenase large terminal subunit/AcrR family transcriptional regulator
MPTDVQPADSPVQAPSGRAGSARELPEVRREQLIQATIRCIAEEGLSHTTVNSVARRAGLTAGMVNFHFNSKQELLTATLQAVMDEFVATIRAAMAEQHDSLADRLLGLVAASFDPAVSEPAKVAVWYSFWGEAPARSEYVAVCSEVEVFHLACVEELIEQACANEDRAINPHALAKGVCGLMDVLWQDIMVEQDRFDRTAAIQTCAQFLESVLPNTFAQRSHLQMPSAIENERTRNGLPLTLPAWTYRDTSFYEAEIERVHLPAWQIVCHQNDIPNTGDFETFDGLGRRAFVIRGEDGQIRAFHNVCPHRAHAVVSGHGNCAGLIRCPYHSWGFDDKGTLKAIAAQKAFPPFDSGKFGLKPVECEVFMGFVFIRFKPGGASVAERFAPVAGELAPYRFEDMESLYDQDREAVRADWKNVWDNYLEDYHFPTGHPGLFSLMGMDYDRQPFDDQRLIRLSHEMREKPKGWAARHYASLLPEQDHLPLDMRRRWTYVYMYPGVAFDVYPDMIDYFHVVPTGAGRSELRYRGYGLPTSDRRMGLVRKLNIRINYQVGAEDCELIESVQAGLESGAYDVGLLGEKEIAVSAMQRWLGTDMADRIATGSG